MPRRNREGEPLRPSPRRGAGRGGGRGGSRRTRGSVRRGAGRALNPFDQSGRRRAGRSLREQEEQPYRYESNDRQLLIIKIALVLWIALAIAATVADYNERRVVDNWADAGFTTLPDSRNTNGLLEFAALEGISCAAEETGEPPAPCQQVFDLAGDLNDATDIGSILFSGFLFLFIAISILVASFAYQANRNLITLKSDGQRFSAVSSMVWMFIPIINFWKGAQIFNEIWKGSDPEASTSKTADWKNGSLCWWVPAWWASFAIVIFFGPRTIRVLFGSSEISDRLDLGWGLMLSDLFLIVPAVLAYLALTAVHERQEQRHEIVGDYLATPPIKGFELK